MSVLDEISRMRYDVWLDKGAVFSRQSIIFHFSDSTWYSIILPIIASFPIIYNFSDEWFSDNYIMTLSRIGFKKYSLSKSISAFVTGFLTFCIGLLMFSVLVLFVFPSLQEYNDKTWYIGLYENYKTAFLAKIVNNAILCGLYGSISVLLCILIKDKFFSLSIYMVIEYFSMKLETKYQNSQYILKDNNHKYLVLFPNRQNDLSVLIPNYVNVSFYWYLLFAFILLSLTTFSIYLIARRRYINAS